MPKPNPRKRPGHFERFEVDNKSPEEVVLEFYVVHDPVDSRFPASGSANIPIAPGGEFVQDPPELIPEPIVQPQVVECEVTLNQSFIMQVAAPPDHFVKNVVFTVRAFDDWDAQAEFEQR